jgi:agmatinase
MKNFDPNAAALENSGIFGLPFTQEEAKLVLLPIPWEVTTSYGGGTSQGPAAILRASKQIDLFDLTLGNFFEVGIAMLEESAEVQNWNRLGKAAAQKVIAAGGVVEDNPALLEALNTVNAYSELLNHFVYTQTKKLLAQGKLVGLIGGDHSTPFGAIQAFLAQYPKMGILHIDAHADMRMAYEGFEHSHASIMYNVLQNTALSTLVQVGIRDFCEEEFDFIQTNADKVATFFDAQLAEKKLEGVPWSVLCDEIIERLPEQVYVSFDIDGLDPRFCPHTGTPVPGGLDFHEVLYLFKKLSSSGRRIIGFDINEVAPASERISDETEESHAPDPAAEWDANVAARLLYALCGWTIVGA